MNKSGKRNIRDLLALTPLQEGILFHYLKEPASDHYVEQLVLTLAGEIQPDRFKKAWDHVVQVNDALRTFFRWEKLEKPAQVVLRHHHPDLEFFDLSTLQDSTEKQNRFEKIVREDREKKFDLRQVPFRVLLCKISDRDYRMVIGNHHILYDGWSTGVILKEFFQAYASLEKGEAPPAPAVNPPFSEFVRWNQNQDQDKQKKFWEAYLHGYDSQIELLIKRQGIKKENEGKAGEFQYILEKGVKERLDDFLRERRITLAAVFYCAWGLLLQRYCDSDDVVFGTTVSGRSSPIKGIEHMVGLFINTIPLRITTEPGEKIKGLVERLNDILPIREEYESTSLVDIKGYSELRNNQELFESIVVLENYPIDRRLMEENTGLPLAVKSYAIIESTHYPLTVSITTGEAIEIRFIYDSLLFEDPALSRLAAHFNTILAGILENFEKDLHCIELLTGEEKQQILVDFNNTGVEYPHDKTLHELFKEQVERTPDHIALHGGMIAWMNGGPKLQNTNHKLQTNYKLQITNHNQGGALRADVDAFGEMAAPDYSPAFPVRQDRLVRPVKPVRPIQQTYRQLNEESDGLAYLLIEQGVLPDTIVGIMTERSMEMILGILAILKAGAAYLPIDPDYPEERIDYLLKDSGAKILLTTSDLANQDEKVKRWEDVLSTPASTLTCRVGSANLAYVIYTSGSTGKPKGVMVNHTSIVNTLSALERMYPFTRADVYLLKTSYLFDVSLAELFGWFFGAEGGGRLAILKPGAEKDPQSILDTVEKMQVTHINFVPSMFNVLVDRLSPHNNAKLSSLKYIFLAGEALLPEVVNKFRSWNRVIKLENLYGPTEAAIYASRYRLEEWSGGDIPIGKPLYNVKLYILNNDGGLQPVGVPGELFIGGSGLARGYLNQPGLTAEKFIMPSATRNPFINGLEKLAKKTIFSSIPGELRESSAHKSVRREMARRAFLGWGCQPPFEKGFLDFPKLLFNYPSPFTFHLSPFYKTGDLSRWQPDPAARGAYIIEFLGRIDYQVKIRGFRIELGEIENQLLKIKSIKEAVVTAREDKDSEKYLCAYIVPRTANSFTSSLEMAETLKSHLLQFIPGYMVPSFFVPMDKIPITSSGKTDRRALPSPQFAPGGKIGKTFTAPRNTLEKNLVEIWSQILGIRQDTIGIDDNFFELGGHSLKAARLLGHIHKKSDVEITLSGLFKTPTVRGLANHIFEMQKGHLSPIEAVEKKEYYELAPFQERFWIFWQFKPDDISYNVSEIMEAEGLLPGEKIETIFIRMIRRHESLRTSFHLLGGNPIQRIHDRVKFEIEYYEVEAEVKVEEEESLSAKSFIYSFIRPFDLTRAPLLRLGLVKVAAEKYYIMFDLHHIVSDGVSIGIFIKEFLAMYAGEELPPLKIQYKDYAAWRKKRKTTVPKIETQDQETVLNLPLDFPRPAVPDFKGKTIKFEIGGLEHSLKLLSGQEEATLYMVLLAAFNVFLARVTGQENIVVGSPMAGRQHPDLEGLIGLFINPLVMQNFPRGHKPFADFLREVKANALRAYENQDYQYEELIEKVASTRTAGRNSLYDVMFVLQNMEWPGIEIPGLKVKREVGESPGSKFDMTLYYEEFNSVFKLEYSTALFKEETIRRFIRYFEKVLGQIVENPRQTIAEIEIITPEEKQQILYDFNETAADYPRDKCIYQLIEDQVRKSPGDLAVRQPQAGEETGDISGDLSLTYRELNNKSNRLATILRNRGVEANRVVGIMIRRSLEMVVGILGILKAGGAYIPIDPEYPANRITNMLESSGAALLLTDRANPVLSLEVETLFIDKENEAKEKISAGNLEPHSGPGDLIYIIFTSGSTGEPKGAGVKHRGFVNLLHWFVTEFGLEAQDRNMLLTSMSFDLTQKNFYAPLITGGCLCIPGMGYFDPRRLLDQIRGNRVTWINCTPSMFYKMVERENLSREKRLAALRYVFLGGEPISMSALIEWLESGDCRAEIVNTYGPTECTDISNFYRVKEPRRYLQEAVPLGKPVNNVRLYILDRNLRLQPVGIPGELCIAGDGVGIGYVNDKILTTRKFIRHSFEPGQPEQYIYRTGDLAKWHPDGNVEFLGRKDHQVKIRGFRIELGEIENRSMSHPTVKEAVVLARERGNGDKYLCAYIVPHPTAVIEIVELREYLAWGLPDYMMPAYFVVMEKMPLNPNGKVDRKALPEPGPTGGQDYVPPQSDVEMVLAGIWAEVLGVKKEQVGIHDHFFQSGGHSLKAAALVGKIHKIFSVEIPITELFQRPTIESISRYIEKTGESPYSSIRPVEKKRYYPLASVQRRLFIIQHLDPGSTTYNIPAVFELEGKLDRKSIEKAFKELLVRHESLRTSFEFIAGEPVQVIHAEVEFAISLVKCQGRGEVSSPAPLPPPSPNGVEKIIGNFIRPFDLSQAPLFRVGLIKMDSHRHLLMVDMHHVISDGVSMGIFIKEFTALYREESLPLLRLQYRDFSHWQNTRGATEKIKKQAGYWHRQLEGEIPVLVLPTDFPRPVQQQFPGKRIDFRVGEEETAGLCRWAEERGATLYMVLFSLFSLWLSKLSGQEDIVIGTAVAGRSHPDLEKIIGMFVNTLPLRTYPSPWKKFPDFLTEIKQGVLESFENQDYQYEELVENLAVQRDLSRNPLFDVLFVLQNQAMQQMELPGLTLTPREYETHTSKFDLTLQCREIEDHLQFTYEYSTCLFKEATIRRYINYFRELLANVLADRSGSLGEMQVIPREEKEQLLGEFNDTNREYPADKTLHRLFEEQAERTPDQVALVGPKAEAKKRRGEEEKKEEESFGRIKALGGMVALRDSSALPIRPVQPVRPVSLTYHELNEESDRLTHLLREKGIEGETIVSIMVERSLEMIIGILGILKNGGAYLPVDSDYPGERIKFMIEDANIGVLLAQSQYIREKNLEDLFKGKIVTIDDIPLSGGKSCDVVNINKSTDIAYIMYTSGSTGRPKGVLVEHRNVIRLVVNTGYIELTEKTRVLQTGAPVFDATTFEVWGPLLNGGQLVLVNNDIILDAFRLGAALKKFGINTLWLTSPLFNQLAREQCEIFSPLEYLLVGGDVLSVGIINLVRKQCKTLKIINGYGPTENTTFSTTFAIEREYERAIPIGSPIGNSTAFVVDQNGGLQPMSVFGELWVGGDGVSRGYLNSPELTAEKFIRPSATRGSFEKPPLDPVKLLSDHRSPLPLPTRYLPEGRLHLTLNTKHLTLYKTGDLARWLPDPAAQGAYVIEFIGRIDHQVKIRGYRVELGEIEKLLTGHRAVKGAVVIDIETAAGDKALCAYIVADTRAVTGNLTRELRDYLGSELPAYMVPTWFVIIDEIPLTANGKVNRRALPSPGMEDSSRHREAPRNEIEKKLVEIFRSVLKLENQPVGINDNFFHLGGHSLKAALLVGQIYKIFNVKIPLSEIFKTPTIKELSGYIRKAGSPYGADIPSVEKKEYYPLSPAQKRLYILQQMDRDTTGYHVPAVFKLEGKVEETGLVETFRQLIERHESLRTSFFMLEDVPVQVVQPRVEFDIRYYEAPGDTGDTQEPKRHHSPLIKKILNNFIVPFDLFQAPLLRVGLIKLEKRKYILMLDIHHIIIDGTSTGILVKEFMALYSGEELPFPSLQYKDFAVWQNSEKEKAILAAQEKYWLKEYAGEIPVLTLPIDFMRPAVRKFEGDVLDFEIGKQQKDAMNTLALNEGVTLFMVLLALYNILLSRLSGQDEIVVGTPTAGRKHADLQQVIGVFINTLPLKSNLARAIPFKEYIKELKETALQAFSNQDYPYEDLVEHLEIERDAGRNPLFDAMFVFQNFDIIPLKIPGLKLTPYRYKSKTSKFDMLLAGMEEEDRISFALEYSINLFEKDTVRRFITYFKTIVSSVLEDSGQRLDRIDIQPREEKREILYDFNDTFVGDPWKKPVHEIFVQQALRIPDHTAVVGPEQKVGRITLTFRSLHERTDGLARLMQLRGIKPGISVGIMMERSLELPIGILAILKAGGIYLPIDPQYPTNRIALLVKTSGIRFLLSVHQVIESKLISLPSLSQETDILHLDEMPIILQEQPPVKLKPVNRPGDLIYIIFTSGSTGIPKGAGVYHRGFTNLMHWFVTGFGLDNRDKNLLLTSLSFDLTQKNMYASLVSGGILYIPDENYFEPPILLKQIFREGITWINCTPGMFYKLVEYEIPSKMKSLGTLRYVFLGGEPIAVTYLLPWLESDTCRAKIVNTYGPTECTDICASYRLQRPRRFMQNTIPLGKPIYNVQLYILDKYLRLAPLGVPGELFIGGAGVGTGYLNDANLTSEKFLRHRFEQNQPEQLLYRTGDLVRRKPDGNIEFVGRLDHQVKIRGFRVEIGEIENQLLSNPQVKEAVVMAIEGPGGDRSLCAYIVPQPIEGFQENEIKNNLAGKLPDYMVPSYFIVLEKMPLNPHGKVDRSALAQTAIKVKPGQDKNYIPPGNRWERILVGLWSETLNLDKSTIGVHDNFFHLGGHSLKAVGLLNRIHREFSVQVPLGELFKAPNVRDLANYIQHSRPTLHTNIEPVEKKEYYPLSSAQKRLYLLQQMELSSTAYNMPRVLPLAAGADIKRLTVVFQELLCRHESLRTSFHMIHDEPVQHIHHHVEFKIEFQRLSINNRRSLGGEENPSPSHCQNRGEVSSPIEIKAIIREFVRPFELSQASLLRVGLIEVGKDRHLLLVDTHHIIMDGTSTDIFRREFVTLYRGEELAPLRLQYKDFSQWQAIEKQGESIKQQEEYWLKVFPPTGEVPVLNLPIDYPRPIMQSFAGSSVDFALSREETLALKRMAQQMGGTLYMAILTLYTILLSKLSGQEDIIIGTPIAARRHVDLECIIGMFANSIAMRNFPAAEKSFQEYLKEVKERTLAAFENQEYQFEDLVEKVVLHRDTGRNPIFDVMFNLLDPVEYTDQLSRIITQGTGENELTYEQVTAKFDMNLTAVEMKEGLQFNLEYCSRLFKPVTINRLTGYFKNLAALLSGNDNFKTKLGDLDILTREEKKEILEISTGKEDNFNHTKKTIHGWFEEQVENNPDSIAVIGHNVGRRAHGVNERRALCAVRHALTYRELNRRANWLAGVLKKRGIKPDTVAVIMMERSVEMITAIWSILKAGGAFLPVDPVYPGERKKHILEDSQAKALLVNDAVKSITCDIPADIEILNMSDHAIVEGDPENPEHIASGSNLIYVIYTSGSTGKPKGVMLEHRNLVNLMEYHYRGTNIDCESVLQFATLCFDMSFHEIFSTLLAGGKLHLIDKDTRADMVELFQLIGEARIRTLFLPMSLLRVIFADLDNMKLIPGCVRHIQTAGEQVMVNEPFRKYLKSRNVYLHNHYGPSETHVVTALTLDPRGEIPEYPSIGTPILNTNIYILDKGNHLVPLGVSGELFIGGVMVGRGYLNKPELTAERFMTNDRSNKFFPNDRLYRSGDLARWLPDGKIEFLGRFDYQVKIRGFRVEPREIESRLLKHGEIKEAVVVAKEDKRGDKYLCAYIICADVSAPGKIPDIPGIRAFLSQTLPDYMIPSYFVPLGKIPLNPNGKVDKKALPEPQITAAGDGPTVEPRGWREKKLAVVWAEVLEIDKGQVGIDANFFHLGGHSLKAAVLISRIHKEFHVKVPLAEVFRTPTIRKLAEHIKGMKQEEYTIIRWEEEKEFYPAAFAQKRIWLLNRQDPGGTTFNMAGKIILESQVDISAIKKALKQIIQRHDSFRTHFEVMNNQLVQVIKKDVEIPLKIKDLTTMEMPEKERKTREIVETEVAVAFDLTQMSLFRALLVKWTGNRYELLFNMHHIVSDGWSLEILKKEFNILYDAYRQGLPCDMGSLALQYKDYAAWQDRLLVNEKAIAGAKGFWKDYLGGTLPVLNLPYDYNATAGSKVSAGYRWVIAEELALRLRGMANVNQASLFMVLLAGFNIMLYQVTHQEDIILAIPAAARQHENLNDIVGLFVNTLVIRSRIDPKQSFMDFFTQMQDRIFNILDYQDIPLEIICSELKIKYPTIHVFFNMINIGNSGHLNLSELQNRHTENVQEAKFDIVCYVNEYRNGIEFDCHYYKERFKPATIEMLMELYKKILENLCADPGKKIKELRAAASKKKLKRSE